MAGGGPFAGGLGILAIALIVFGAIVFLPLLILGVILLAVAAVMFFVARDPDYETPPDPVTGGPRWWQKRYDE